MNRFKVTSRWVCGGSIFLVAELLLFFVLNSDLAQRFCIGAVGVLASAIRLLTSCSVFSADIFLCALLRFPILAREMHPCGSQPSPCFLEIYGLIVLRNRVLNPGLRCARPR